MAELRDINISKDIVAKYKTEEIIRFVTAKLKKHNRNSDDNCVNDSVLQFYIDILDELDKKLNGQEILSII